MELTSRRQRRTQGRNERGASRILSSGGFIALTADGCPSLMIPVASAATASALLQRYRDQHCIGASDMRDGCGNIYANEGTLVATVSWGFRRKVNAIPG